MNSSEAVKMICHPTGYVHADYNSNCLGCGQRPCRRMMLVSALIVDLRDTESQAAYNAKSDAKRGAPTARGVAYRAEFFAYRARCEERLIKAIAETPCTCSEHNH